MDRVTNASGYGDLERLTIRVPKSIAEDIRKIAKARNVSFNKAAIDLLSNRVAANRQTLLPAA